MLPISKARLRRWSIEGHKNCVRPLQVLLIDKLAQINITVKNASVSQTLLPAFGRPQSIKWMCRLIALRPSKYMDSHGHLLSQATGSQQGIFRARATGIVHMLARSDTGNMSSCFATHDHPPMHREELSFGMELEELDLQLQSLGERSEAGKAGDQISPRLERKGDNVLIDPPCAVPFVEASSASDCKVEAWYSTWQRACGWH